MGQLLSFLTGKDAGDAFVDFENATPTEETRVLYHTVADQLMRGRALLEQLSGYQGCGDAIREAFSHPSKATEDKAWRGVLKRVDDIKAFHDFSVELEEPIVKLLETLCSGDMRHTLQDQEALAKQLADLLDFALKFDEMKMHCPQLQNDFSYYRRALQRRKPPKDDPTVHVKDDDATKLSMFLSQASPMMSALNASVSKMAQQRDGVRLIFASMANICFTMVQKRRFENEATNLFCLRAMTGAIILFDHVDRVGAFHKRSPVQIKGCIQCLMNYRFDNLEAKNTLVNSLRYSTLHLKDRETPTSITELLNAAR